MDGEARNHEVRVEPAPVKWTPVRVAQQVGRQPASTNQGHPPAGGRRAIISAAGAGCVQAEQIGDQVVQGRPGKVPVVVVEATSTSQIREPLRSAVSSSAEVAVPGTAFRASAVAWS